MTRPLSPAVAAASSSAELRLVLLVEAAFSAGSYQVTTAPHELSWGGETFEPAGALLSVGDLEETAEITARGLRLTLSGIDPAIRAVALAEPYQGRPLILWLAILDDEGGIDGDPVQLGRWLMDAMTITTTGSSMTIDLAAESRLVRLRHASDRRYTDEDQQIDYPGDRGLEFVSNVPRSLSGNRGSGGGGVPPPNFPHRGL